VVLNLIPATSATFITPSTQQGRTAMLFLPCHHQRQGGVKHPSAEAEFT